jgi:NADPH2:quinone reductase
MQAIVCHKYGPPSDLVLSEIPSPEAKAGEVVIEVHAAGVNFPDALLVQGLYQVKPPLPFSPGVEVAGVVRAVGPGVDHPRVGERVAAMVMGGFAEHAVARASSTVALPDDIDFVTAASLTLTYGTAYHALVGRADLQPGEWLFVTGAGGGVGTAAVDLGKALGAHVVAAAGSESKREAARALGADVVVDANAPDLVDILKRVTDGGIDVALDNVGGAQFDAALRAARWRARLLVVGFASGTIPSIPANRALLRELDIRGVYFGAWAERHPHAMQANFGQIFTLLRNKNIAPRVAESYAFADAPLAIADLLERRLIGKGVVHVRA